MKTRFHVRLGKKRTTVLVDTYLSTLLCLKLGFDPKSPPSHNALCHWLQAKLDHAADPKRIHVSQWLREQVVFQLLDTRVSKQYDEWILQQ